MSGLEHLSDNELDRMDPRDARVAAENWRRLEARLAGEPVGGKPAGGKPPSESQAINDLIRGRGPRNRLTIIAGRVVG
jgi:hypothetical protein